MQAHGLFYKVEIFGVRYGARGQGLPFRVRSKFSGSGAGGSYVVWGYVQVLGVSLAPAWSGLGCQHLGTSQ